MDRGASWATVCGVAKIQTCYTYAHQLILSAVAIFFQKETILSSKFKANSLNREGGKLKS